MGQPVNIREEGGVRMLEEQKTPQENFQVFSLELFSSDKDGAEQRSGCTADNIATVSYLLMRLTFH